MTLDTLVATAGMGWPVIGFSDPVPKGGYVRLQCAYFGSDHPDRCGIFQPSTNIAHAHMFRDKVLRENPNAMTEESSWCVDGKQRFRAECWNRPKGYGEGVEGTSSIAICLAALRAMGVPDKEIEEVCGGE
jgi:hypothetical protein